MISTFLVDNNLVPNTWQTDTISMLNVFVASDAPRLSIYKDRFVGATTVMSWYAAFLAQEIPESTIALFVPATIDVLSLVTMLGTFLPGVAIEGTTLRCLNGTTIKVAREFADTESFQFLFVDEFLLTRLAYWHPVSQRCWKTVAYTSVY